jgi:hypothetical protein
MKGSGVRGGDQADRHRAAFHLGDPQWPGHAHIAWELIDTHAKYERDY